MTTQRTALLLGLVSLVLGGAIHIGRAHEAEAASGIVVNSISPSRGPATGNVLVVISGTGFPTAGDCEGPIIEVLFGNLSAFPLEIPTRTQVRVLPPPQPAGPVDVTVRNLCDQTVATIEGGYTYTSPAILSGSIPRAGGFGLFVFGGGSNEELVKASGCPRETVTFWATNPSGRFVTFIPGAGVQAVNDGWNQLFPTGIPFQTALIGRCV